MNETLQWFFELVDQTSAPARVMTQALEGLARVQRLVTGSARGMDGRLRDAGGRFAASAASARGASGAWGMFTDGLGNAAAVVGQAWGVVSGIGGRIVDFGAVGARMVIDSARFQENTLTSLRTILRSESEASRVYDQARAIAQNTPLAERDLVDMVRNLVLGGFEGNDLTTAIAMAADVRAGMGEHGAEASAGLIRVMGQLRGGREMSAELMESLGNAGVGRRVLYPEIARMLHIDTTDTVQMNAAVEAAMHSHRLSAEQGLVAIRNVVAQRFSGGHGLGGGSVDASRTLEGALSNFGDIFNSLLSSIRITQLPGMQQFRQLLVDVTSMMSAASPVGARLRATIIELVNGAGAMLGRINVAEVTTRLMAFVDRVAAAGPQATVVLTRIGKAAREFAAGFMDGIGPALPAFRAFREALTGMWDTLRPVNSGVVSLGDVFRFVGTAAGGVVAAVAIFVGAIATGLATVTGAVVGFWELAYALYVDVPAYFNAIGTNMVAGIRDGIRAAWGALVADITGLAQSLPGPVRRALGIHSPSTVFAGLGRDTMAGFGVGIEQGAAGLDGMLAGAIAPPALRGGLGGGMSVSAPVSVTVEVHGAAHMDPEQLASAVARATVGEFANVFEQLGIEQGAI